MPDTATKPGTVTPETSPPEPVLPRPRGRHRKPRPRPVLFAVGGLALAAGALSLLRVARPTGRAAPAWRPRTSSPAGPAPRRARAGRHAGQCARRTPGTGNGPLRSHEKRRTEPVDRRGTGGERVPFGGRGTRLPDGPGPRGGRHRGRRVGEGARGDRRSRRPPNPAPTPSARPVQDARPAATEPPAEQPSNRHARPPAAAPSAPARTRRPRPTQDPARPGRPLRPDRGPVFRRTRQPQ